jgi:hypothetical protein
MTGEKLDELQWEAERLAGLLQDRQPGLFTWHEMVAKRIAAIRRLTDASEVA